MKLGNQFIMQVTQPSDHLSNILKLEEGKRKRCDLLQNGVILGAGGASRNLNDKTMGGVTAEE